MKTKVGFIGLGVMGKRMAKNLVKKGYDLTVHDVMEEPVTELKQLGAKEASSAKKLAAAVEVIFSMVRDDAQTEEVMWGKNGVLEGISSSSTIIVSSTVSPTICQRLAKDASKKGARVLDCPVSGARTGAEAGTLTLMVGGDEDLFKKMEPILQAISANIFYLGSIGMGEAGKLVNNLVLNGNREVLREGLAFGVKAGIPYKTILDFIKVSTGGSWAAENWELLGFGRAQPQVVGPSIGNKDVRLALEYAKEIGVELPHIRSLF